MSIANYERQLRAAVRGFWSGAITRAQFISQMDSSIRRGITQAWMAGAGEGNVKPGEYSVSEKAALSQFIFNEQTYVPDFADYIKEHSKANGTKLGKVLKRVPAWVNKYREATAKAGAMAAGDKKKKFNLGPTEKHCKSCSGLNGRVYRYSVWLANDAIPPSRNFSCGGYHCKCTLDDTNEPITKGKFPTLVLAR